MIQHRVLPFGAQKGQTKVQGAYQKDYTWFKRACNRRLQKNEKIHEEQSYKKEETNEPHESHAI